VTLGTFKRYSGRFSAHFLQINNAINYEADFSLEIPYLKKRFGTRFHITTPAPWLKAQLERLRSTTKPIIIGMHKLEEEHKIEMIELLSEW